MFKAAILIICTITLIQGCVSSSVKPVADVTSTPSKALVYANGIELGQTPLHYQLFEAFPASWSNSSYQAQGLLVLKRSGCEDFTLKITDYILSKPIHADLKCSETLKSVKPSTPATAENSIQSRLEKLQDLYKKGLISNDELLKSRERILNEL